jgi:hypothetical protein
MLQRLIKCCLMLVGSLVSCGLLLPFFWPLSINIGISFMLQRQLLPLMKPGEKSRKRILDSWLMLVTQFMTGSILLESLPPVGPKWGKLMRPVKKFANNSMLLTCSEKSEVSKRQLLVSSTKTNESAPCSLGNPLWKKPKKSVNS